MWLGRVRVKPMIWGKGYRRVGMWLGRVRGGGGYPKCVTETKPMIWGMGYRRVGMWLGRVREGGDARGA